MIFENCLILFGPPGAGKGTQAKHLVKKLNGIQISTGDMLRDEIKNDSEIGKKIIKDMNDGKYVSDEIVNKLIKDVVIDPNKKGKLIFDGYPRSLSQAKNLENRSDDDLNTILKRYDTYMETTKPVLEYYSKNPNFHEIDGALEIDQITNKIDAFLKV